MEKLRELIEKKEFDILKNEFPQKSIIEKYRDMYEMLQYYDFDLFQIDNVLFFDYLVCIVAKEYDTKANKLTDLNGLNSNNSKSYDFILNTLEYRMEQISNSNLTEEEKTQKIKEIDIADQIYNSQHLFDDIEQLKIFLDIFKKLYLKGTSGPLISHSLAYFVGSKCSLDITKDKLEVYNQASRAARRLFSSYIEDTFFRADLVETLKTMTNSYEKLNSEYDNFVKNQKRKCMLLRKILYLLEQKLDKHILLDNEISKLIDQDDETKKEVLRVVLENNEKKYFELKKENNINSDNSITQLERLLFDFNINPDLISSDNRILLLQLKSINELREILEILKNPIFSFLNIHHPNYINILLYSSSSILIDIINNVKEGKLRTEFLENNTEILIPTHDNQKDDERCYYYTIKENIKVLDKYRFKWNELSLEQYNILLTNPQRLKNILSSLEKYFIPFNQLSCYYFLQYPELIKYIDTFIELDLYDLLLDYPEELTKNNDIIKRIIILKSINEQLTNKSGYIRNSILTGKNFYVADDNLDDYIINHTEYFIDKNAKAELDVHEHFQISDSTLDIKEINNLEENFKVNDFMYNFDGIIISRPKVLRCFEHLSKGNYNINNNLFSSIIYNSNISSEEILQIKELLFGRKLQ